MIARSVGAHDEGDEVLRTIAVIGQQLLGVLGQTVAAVAEGGVVAVRANPRLQAHVADAPASRIRATRGGLRGLRTSVGIPAMPPAFSRARLA